MRVCVGLPVDRHDIGDDILSSTGIAACARAVEDAGLDGVFVTDHPAPDARWLRRGGHPTLDPFVTLSVAAATTTRLHLHTNLLVLPYRNPLLAAKSVASLDVLSGGRVVLGVGVGYLRPEFAALGADFDSRAALADDALTAMVAAWTGEPVDHDGIGYTARDTLVLPRPAQRPHPPIWVGGNSRAAMRRAVQHGQGWSPMPSAESQAAYLGTPSLADVDQLAGRVRELHDMAAAAGRSEPLDVAVIPQSLSLFEGADASAQAAIDEIGQLREAGGTVLMVVLPGSTLDAFVESVDRFAEDVLARVDG